MKGTVHIQCPRCGSTEINQYRMPSGPMWCMKCGFRVEDKNAKPNPFVEAAKESAQKANTPKPK
ncbi:MAG: hypothetical protein ACOYZ6_10525 [Chloroflexota bacterium]